MDIYFFILAVFSLPLFWYVFWHLACIFLSIKELISRNNNIPKKCDYKIAVLYTTCNDFNEEALSSIVMQKGIDFEVFILDDSTSHYYRREIDKWVGKNNHNLKIIRRNNRNGFKGGNINNWLKKFGDEERFPYVLLVDSDEMVPETFSRDLLNCIVSSDYSFVQACHSGSAKLSSFFQRVLHPQVECEWFYQVPAWNIFNSPPILGHGTMIKTKCLKSVGGFPDFVSEDLALTIEFMINNRKGIIATNIIAKEEFPNDYESYWKRRYRWISADSEIISKLLKKFLTSKVGIIQRICLSIREIRLFVGSFFWIILVLLSFGGIFGVNPEYSLPFQYYFLFFMILSPVFPALMLSRINLIDRLLFIFSMTFIGAATCSLHPIASLEGLLGFNNFESTNSKVRDLEAGRDFKTPWELISGVLFIISGFWVQNLLLSAIGFAILFSIILRRVFNKFFFYTGVIIFWLLIFIQIQIDFLNNNFPIDHLLSLIGLSITLL